MANTKIQARKESLILRELTLILMREIKVEVLKSVSISEVRLTNDNEVAKIYYSFIAFNGLNKEIIEEELEFNNKKIRRILASKLKSRNVPELNFIYDTSLDNANNIERILKEVNKN